MTVTPTLNDRVIYVDVVIGISKVEVVKIVDILPISLKNASVLVTRNAIHVTYDNIALYLR